MKKFVSLLLISVTIISLMSITVFAEPYDTITFTFTPPDVGASIETDLQITAHYNGVALDGISVIPTIYGGLSANDVKSINDLQAYKDFLTNNSDKAVILEAYTQQDYVAIFSVSSSNIDIDESTKASVPNYEGGELFFDSGRLFVYIAFSLSKDTTENITSTADIKSKDVFAVYEKGASSATVYSVDITWGDMKFTYTDASEGTWNPNTHEFDEIVAASWSSDGNEIIITNHSNTNIEASFSYTNDDDFGGITGNFVDNLGETLLDSKLNIRSAVNTEPNDAPSGTAVLNLSGTLSSEITTETQCGTVTVTIK